MIDLTCNDCGTVFQVAEEYRNNKKCKGCFFKAKGNGEVKAYEPSVVTELSISTQSIFKSVCTVRPKNVKIEKLVEETLFVIEKLRGK